MTTNTHRFTIGHFTCTIVPDGAFAYTHPAAVLFANAPQAALAEALATYQIDPATWEAYLSPYPSLVIDTGQQRVLVDTALAT